MGTETTRRHRRHNQTATITTLPPRPERPRAAYPTSSSSSSYTFQRPSESITLSSLNTFNNTPTNNSFNTNNISNTFNSGNLNFPVNASNNNNQSNTLDFQNPNILFGSLLEEDLPVETVEEYGPSRPGPGPNRPSLLHPLMPRELRHSARREFEKVTGPVAITSFFLYHIFSFFPN